MQEGAGEEEDIMMNGNIPKLNKETAFNKIQGGGIYKLAFGQAHVTIHEACADFNISPKDIWDETHDEDTVGDVTRSCEAVIYTITNGEIIEFDSCFDNIITDTAPSCDNVRFPFRCFYINKWFSCEKNTIVPGVAVIGDGNEGGISFIANNLDKGCTSTSRRLSDILQSNVDLYREIGAYVLNCINIINNPDRDIKEIERFPSHKKLDPTHRKYDPYARKTTYITVGGELKKYIGEYNKRREAVGHNPSFIVRGHWRHFRSSRYKNKQGQSKWIYPYIKGMPEELVHRFVKVVPGDSKK